MKSRTRRARKQEAIIEHVRGMVINGKLSPGMRVPVRSEIEKLFNASSVTVQRAFDRLAEDGFLTVRGTEGTFVADRPPHLNRYGLIFSGPREKSSRYLAAITSVTAQFESVTSMRLHRYFDVDEGIVGEGQDALRRDILRHRLAGGIFVGAPKIDLRHVRPGAAVLAQVALMSPPLLPHVPAVDLGGVASFFDRALEYLASKGRKRIALVSVPAIESERLDYFRGGLARYGMSTEPYWIQAAEVGETATEPWASHLTHLMFRAGQEVIPDGLIVSDDNLVEYACAGLVSSGVSVPEQLDVVVHCNFPAVVPSGLPVARLGYDLHEVLETCLQLLARQKESMGSVPEHAIIQPIFESEIRNRDHWAFT
jgi:DNA-binding transcriptional regulator YhcF (GntR family)